MAQSIRVLDQGRYAALVLGIVLAAVLLGMALPQIAAAGPGMPKNSADSVGCGKPAARAGLFTLNATDGDKRNRSFLVQVPPDYQQTRRYALTLVFHGSGGSSAESSSWGLQSAPGAAATSIFVFPNGIDYQRFGVGWDDTKNGYDMIFFDNMTRGLEAAYCIDTNRVFVAGFSWGGDFAIALACARGSAIRAAAVNSATDEFGSSANYLTYQNLPCPGSVRPAVLFAHAEGSDSQYPAPFFATTSNLIRSLNACAATSRSVPSSSSAMACVSFDGCAKEYVECNFAAGVGHRLPPNWAGDTWAFFAKFH